MKAQLSFVGSSHFSSDPNTEHRLPITQHAMDLINSLPKRGTYIFSVKGIKPITTRTIERWYQSLNDDVGIKFTSHDIRKLARDSWQDMDIDWVIGEMLLNHERDGLDKRYMHTHSREQMRKALGEWGVKLNQACENKKIY